MSTINPSGFGTQLLSFFGLNSYSNHHPDTLMKTKADEYLKKMFEPSVDPKLQELLKQTQNVAQEAFAAPQPVQTPTFVEQTAHLVVVETAETVNQVAEILVEATEETTAAEVMTNTAEAVVEATENTFKEPPLSVENSKKLIISRLISATASSLKSLPYKLFFLGMLAYHNEERRCSNINLYFTSKKKVVEVEIGSDNLLKRFKFEIASDGKLNILNDLPFDCLATGLTPSFMPPPSLIERIFSPIIGLGVPKVYDERIFNVIVQHQPESPCPGQESVKTIRLSVNEILRFSNQASTNGPTQLKLADDEEMHSTSADDLDNLHLIDIEVKDDERDMNVPLPDLSGNQHNDYIKITQR